MFGSRRSRETNPVYVDDVRFSETSPIKFVGIRPRESKPRSNFCLAPDGQGKRILYMYVGAVRLSETSRKNFWRNKADGN